MSLAEDLLHYGGARARSKLQLAPQQSQVTLTTVEALSLAEQLRRQEAAIQRLEAELADVRERADGAERDADAARDLIDAHQKVLGQLLNPAWAGSIADVADVPGVVEEAMREAGCWDDDDPPAHDRGKAGGGAVVHVLGEPHSAVRAAREQMPFSRRPHMAGHEPAHLVIDVLRDARVLLEDPLRWFHSKYDDGCMALAVDGGEASPVGQAAVCWTAEGAVRHAIVRRVSLTVAERQRLAWGTIAALAWCVPAADDDGCTLAVDAFNALPDTTHADILALFDWTIAKLQQWVDAGREDDCICPRGSAP